MSGLPLFTRALWNVGWRYLLRHPWQSALMVLGIALGVAVVVSIDLANVSASRAFVLSTQTLTGLATHQITGGPRGLDEKVYVDLKRSGWAGPAAPVVSDYISSPQLGSRPLQLLGIDPFSDGPFRSFLSSGSSVPLDQLDAFLTRPGAVLISKPLAERYHLGLGSPLTILAAGSAHPAFIAGLLEPADNLSRTTLDGVVLADISTAQEFTGMLGRLNRIDLILPEGRTDLLQSLRARLPQGAQLSTSAARTSEVQQMTDAFQVNLTALSLLALVVGLFLIYNTMTFSVVQRRELFGILRCLGVTRREVFAMVLAEAAVVGLVGALSGIGLGILMGKVTVGMVSQTVNDLYFTTTVQATGISIQSLIKGGTVGLLATLFTAALPAWEAAAIPPRAALLRSGLESKARRSAGWSAAAGGVAVVLALMIFRIPSSSIYLGFGGTLLTILGAALFSSAAVVLLVRLLAPLTAWIFGVVGRMAPRSLLNSLSRTAVAVTALMVAVAVTIGVSVMIDSFRHTVVVWLDETLHSDVYISAPIYTSTTPSDPIDPRVIQALQSWPGVQRVDVLRSSSAQSRQGPVNLSATQNPDIGAERLFLALQGTRQSVWSRMQAGDVLVSEPLANRLDIKSPGEAIELNTPQGWKSFRVIGIYYDYSSSEGTLLMALDPYRRIWNDPTLTAVGLRLASGIDPAVMTRDLEERLNGSQQLLIRANRTLREDVLMVFDRTFAITVALRLLATLVAFIGVLSALFLLQIEKQREVGILRALGLTTGQLRRMVFIETGLMGLVAGFLAIPTGYALSLILVYVINRRSFGWTLQMTVTPAALVQGILVALAAALIAGIYPAVRLSRMQAAEAIRYE